MNRSSLILLALLLLGFNLRGQSTDPWAVKKQRKNTGQQPSFTYQTRNGAKAASHKLSRLSPPLASPLPSASIFKLKGTQEEPPHEIKGVLPETTRTNARGKTDLLSASQQYLQEVSHLMQIQKPDQEFVLQRDWKDTRGMQHLRMQQQYRGVRVYGSEIIVHADEVNIVQGLNGRYMASPESLNTIPTVNGQAAIRTSLAFFESNRTLQPLNSQQQQLLKYTGPTAGLVILPAWEAGKATLAWRVEVRPNFLDHWEMFVDAHTGRLISQTNMTCSFAPELKGDHTSKKHNHLENHRRDAAPQRLMGAGKGNGRDLNGVNRTLEIWQIDGASALVDASKDMFAGNNNTPLNELKGVLITYDADRKPNPETVSIVNETTTTFRDPSAVSAHYNASIAYDYFRTIHNRNSIDGVGGNVLSIINMVEDDGSEMDNAYWNGQYMAYGNGNIGFKPLAGAIDVAGHEMSHGVIGSTAGLVYRDQTGAINEHIADVFGVLIDINNYTLGEDVVLTEYFPSGALRDMEAPHNGGTSLDDNGWQPDHMREIYTGSQDNGGVHINSGILNRAFFLMATELGREKIGDIYYDALTKYLTASAEFADLRRALINSANDLYGQAEVQAIMTAFEAVGITEQGIDPDDGGGPIEDDDELPAIGGEDLLLTVNTDPDDENSLYLINLDQDSFEPISVTSVKRKPTVVDDGSIAFFITEDETIRGIELAPPYNEEAISDDALWANLSISKDGNRLAIISNQLQPEIWVADLTRDTDMFTNFKLFNPTTQEGVVTYDVQYADAIEWDYSGEYLIYDAFNKVETTGLIERDVEYWDVNFIHVWDNTANDFGDGAILKIFTNLPEGTSIGNPSFSKTNRNIVCFDLFDETNETYLVIASNLETGETMTVYENNTLGFPSYSNDDRMMVFDTFDEDGTPLVAQLPLSANKLEAAGEPTFPYIEAQWTTWFSQGERVINSAENNLLSFGIEQPNGAKPGTIAQQTISLSVPDTVDVIRMVATFKQSPQATVYVGEFRQISGITTNDFTEDVIYRVVAQNGNEKQYTVQVTQEKTQPNPTDPDPDDPDDAVGIEDEIAATPLVYPNPFDQEIFLSEALADKSAKLTLYNVLGQAIALKKQGKSYRLTQPIPPGLYLLTVQQGASKKTIRLVRQ